MNILSKRNRTLWVFNESVITQDFNLHYLVKFPSQLLPDTVSSGPSTLYFKAPA